MARLSTYKYYLLEMIEIIKENNNKIIKEVKQNKDDFLAGQQFAYYDILTIMQQQAIAFGIDEAELGLDEVNEAELITAMT